ncbi:MAG: hypothetical protein JWP13_308 [Candidatus Saccharibacteria bacterium]|nr:hypothetical protein [Candidatus Saccharibacteria bacterium]
MIKFWKNNSLSIVMFLLFFIFLTGHSVTGLKQYNAEQELHSQPTVSYVKYLGSGDFIESVFENWESEFLQMGSYVLLTVFLQQKGSAESKKLEGGEDVDRDPKKTKNPDAPGPVKRGGLALKLYKNSLSIAFVLLFLMSFALHGLGGANMACEENQAHGQPCESTLGFMTSSEFWYQSFQNWQSEYLAVFAIVILSVYLRQQGSPESKPVNTPHYGTGS